MAKNKMKVPTTTDCRFGFNQQGLGSRPGSSGSRTRHPSALANGLQVADYARKSLLGDSYNEYEANDDDYSDDYVEADYEQPPFVNPGCARCAVDGK
jgi:hypothetical protein